MGCGVQGIQSLAGRNTETFYSDRRASFASARTFSERLRATDRRQLEVRSIVR